MAEGETRHTSEHSEGATPTEDEQAMADAKAVETARRWAQSVTIADHAAIYESMGRDYKGWLQRQEDEKIAS